MNIASNKTNTLQQILDDDKQYQLSSVIADVEQDEKLSSKKFMDKTMKELMQMERDIK